MAEKEPGDFEVEEKEKRQLKRKTAADAIAATDWSKVKTVDDVIVVIKQLIEVLA